MYTIQLMLSSLLVQLYYARRPPAPAPEQVTVLSADPRPLGRADCEWIRQNLLRRAGWQSGMSLEEVAHQQGMHDLLELIETKVLRRHSG